LPPERDVAARGVPADPGSPGRLHHRSPGVTRAPLAPRAAAAHREVVAAGYSPEQVRAAWDRRRSDLADLAGVADELADVDRRAAEINERIDQLMTMGIAP